MCFESRKSSKKFLSNLSLACGLFVALSEFRGENSVSSSQPIICAKANSPSFVAELTEFAPKLSEAQ